jgi:hypothetical protein
MTNELETRDAMLGEMLEQITVPQLNADALERFAQTRRAVNLRPPQEPRRRLPAIVIGVTLVTAGVAVALIVTFVGAHRPTSSTNASGPPAPTSLGSSGGSETDVRTLLAFGHAVNARTRRSLPPRMAGMLSTLVSRFRQPPSSIAEPIVGPPSVYLVTFKPNQLCVALVALKGAVWECRVTLQQAGGSLSVGQAIVDGKRLVYGLAANDVRSISVSSAATATTPPSSDVQAQLANNAFVAPLPYDGGFALGTVTVTVTRTDGSTATVELQGPGGPAGIGGTMINPATGAPGAADASKKRVLIASKNATLWTAPRSDGSGYCVWTTVLPNGGGSSQCNLPTPPERELGLGLLEESVLEGRVGSDVTRVDVTFADGTKTRLRPVEGWILLGGIAASAEPLTATAYNRAGNRVGTQTLG